MALTNRDRAAVFNALQEQMRECVARIDEMLAGDALHHTPGTYASHMERIKALGYAAPLLLVRGGQTLADLIAEDGSTTDFATHLPQIEAAAEAVRTSLGAYLTGKATTRSFTARMSPLADADVLADLAEGAYPDTPFHNAMVQAVSAGVETYPIRTVEPDYSDIPGDAQLAADLTALRAALVATGAVE